VRINYVANFGNEIICKNYKLRRSLLNVKLKSTSLSGEDFYISVQNTQRFVAEAEVKFKIMLVNKSGRIIMINS
jgi:hypothetical protein